MRKVLALCFSLLLDVFAFSQENEPRFVTDTILVVDTVKIQSLIAEKVVRETDSLRALFAECERIVEIAKNGGTTPCENDVQLSIVKEVGRSGKFKTHLKARDTHLEYRLQKEVEQLNEQLRKTFGKKGKEQIRANIEAKENELALLHVNYDKNPVITPDVADYIGYYRQKVQALVERDEEMLKSKDFVTAYRKLFNLKAKSSSQVDDLPRKSLVRQIPNPNHPDNLTAEQKEALELKRQTQGWEWANEELPRKTETYPDEVSYKYSDSHPEYKIVGLYGEPEGVFKDKKLIRVLSLTRNHMNYSYYGSKVFNEIYKQDYLANKYNIKSESADVQKCLKIKFGLDEADLKSGLKLAELDLAYNAAKTAEERGKIRQQAVALFFKAYSQAVNETAGRFIKQLESDHQDDLRKIKSIDRVSDLEFDVVFMNKEDRITYTVRFTFFQVKDFGLDFKITLM